MLSHTFVTGKLNIKPMKKIRLSIAVLLSVWSLAGLGEAKADTGLGVSSVKIEKSDSKKVRIYTKPGSPVDLTLIDIDGYVLYKGLTSANNKTGEQIFNLNNLPDGRYFITAGNNDWWMSQGITIRGNVVSIDERNLMQMAQPTLTTYAKNKIEVTVPGKNLDDASVAIYDAKNELVFSEAYNGGAQRFDLSSLPTGAYTVVVGLEQKHFSSRVTVAE
jgi:hypothetical protein